MNYTIKAKSSGEEPYLVDFALNDNQLTVSCNCQAGMFGKLCKHTTELLAGDKTRLFDESEESTLRQIHGLAQRAPEILQLSNEIAECEQIVKAAQAKLKKAKKNLEAALSHGVEINAS